MTKRIRPGQFRLIVLGRKAIGAGQVIRPDPQVSDTLGIRYWEVEDLTADENRIVVEWDIRRELNAMEVLAWATSDLNLCVLREWAN